MGVRGSQGQRRDGGRRGVGGRLARRAGRGRAGCRWLQSRPPGSHPSRNVWHTGLAPGPERGSSAAGAPGRQAARAAKNCCNKRAAPSTPAGAPGRCAPRARWRRRAWEGCCTSSEPACASIFVHISSGTPIAVHGLLHIERTCTQALRADRMIDRYAWVAVRGEVVAGRQAGSRATRVQRGPACGWRATGYTGNTACACTPTQPPTHCAPLCPTALDSPLP